MRVLLSAWLLCSTLLISPAVLAQSSLLPGNDTAPHSAKRSLHHKSGGSHHSGSRNQDPRKDKLPHAPSAERDRGASSSAAEAGVPIPAASTPAPDSRSEIPVPESRASVVPHGQEEQASGNEKPDAASTSAGATPPSQSGNAERDAPVPEPRPAPGSGGEIPVPAPRSSAVPSQELGKAGEKDHHSGEPGETSSQSATSSSAKVESGATAPLPATQSSTSVPVPEPRPDASPLQSGDEAATSRSDKGAKATPEELKQTEFPVSPEMAVQAAAAIKAAKDCEAELKTRGVVFKVDESRSEGQCGVLRPLVLETLSSGVAVNPDTVLICQTALALDRWISDSVVPTGIKEFDGAKLVSLDNGSTYSCRSRVGEGETKVSEHARGDAIDVLTMTFEGGRSFTVKKQDDNTAEQRFQEAIRSAACGPFKTVLGPGTNEAHANHLHLDLAERRNGASYCQ